MKKIITIISLFLMTIQFGYTQELFHFKTTVETKWVFWTRNDTVGLEPVRIAPGVQLTMNVNPANVEGMDFIISETNVQAYNYIRDNNLRGSDSSVISLSEPVDLNHSFQIVNKTNGVITIITTDQDNNSESTYTLRSGEAILRSYNKERHFVTQVNL